MSAETEIINAAVWQFNEALSMLTQIELEREASVELLEEIEESLPTMRGALADIAGLVSKPPRELTPGESL